MNVMVKPVRPSRLMGYVRDPDKFFADEKQRILAKLGDISGIKVTLNRILVVVWSPESGFMSEGGIEIIKPDVTKDENKWQGVSALVVAMGPHCFEENEQISWHPDEICKVGDWVFFSKGEGRRVEVWQNECVMLENERSIRAIVDRPDAVY